MLSQYVDPLSSLSAKFVEKVIKTFDEDFEIPNRAEILWLRAALSGTQHRPTHKLIDANKLARKLQKEEETDTSLYSYNVPSTHQAQPHPVPLYQPTYLLKGGTTLAETEVRSNRLIAQLRQLIKDNNLETRFEPAAKQDGPASPTRRV